jgi:hypothetical protein
MRKLRLNVEELTVESFVPAGSRTKAGTVKANEYTEAFTCDYNACGGTLPGACNTNDLQCASGDYSCQYNCTNDGRWTCADTCGYPCPVSQMTDCHRCTANNSDYSVCPDLGSACFCG